MGGRWTIEDEATLLALNERGLDHSAIATRLGRSESAIYIRLLEIKNSTPEEREIRRAAKAAKQYARNAAVKATRNWVEQVNGPKLDPEMRRRLNEAAKLQPRDLTGLIMGDPPVGRSALDARRGHAPPS